MKKLILVLIVILLGLLAVGMILPKEYTTQRSVVINADSAKIHQWVADLKRWDEWTPWKENDPSMKVTYGSTTAGLGANQSWTSDSMGGELTITESDAAKGIAYNMTFIQGDTRTPAQGQIAYRAAQGGTEVVWSAKGDCEGMGPLDGWMAVLMDRFLLGPMFDKGLTKLKTVAEKA